MSGSIKLNPPKEVAIENELVLPADFRMTKQRREVYEVLMQHRSHPTASEVFMFAKEHMPTISLATVYNCLETLTHAGLVKQVNFDREPSRYCPNLAEHGHFHCTDCGEVADIEFKHGCKARELTKLPKGTIVEQLDIAIKGTCPACSKKRQNNN
ncbi:MAG: Fe2+ or Zn2+ uptake regulation protein [Verrucomicrobiales bacterium]|jgi:Fe2+ or Zn2+ uptake regulation protein